MYNKDKIGEINKVITHSKVAPPKAADVKSINLKSNQRAATLFSQVGCDGHCSLTIDGKFPPLGGALHFFPLTPCIAFVCRSEVMQTLLLVFQPPHKSF